MIHNPMVLLPGCVIRGVLRLGVLVLKLGGVLLLGRGGLAFGWGVYCWGRGLVQTGDFIVAVTGAPVSHLLSLHTDVFRGRGPFTPRLATCLGGRGDTEATIRSASRFYTSYLRRFAESCSRNPPLLFPTCCNSPCDPGGTVAN